MFEDESPGPGRRLDGYTLPADLLLPRPDTGVAATVAFAVALWFVRRHRDARHLVIGVRLMACGFSGVRAID